MNIKINARHFSASSKLEEFIQNKLNKLNQYSSDIVAAEVFLSLEKAQAPDNKVVKLKIEVPNNELFAEKQSATFEEATDHTIEAVKKQLIKRKEKFKK